MAILYTATRSADLSSTRADQPISYGTAKTTNTTYIDPNYTKNTLYLSGNATALNATVRHGEPSGDTLWWHFTFSYTGHPDDDGYWFIIRDVNDNDILYTDILNGGFTGYLYGDTTLTSTSFNSMRTTLNGAKNEYDLALTVNSTETAVKVYQNDQLIISLTTPNTLGNVGKPNYTVLGMNDMAGTVYTKPSMSQLIWADENTRRMKLAELSMDTAGTQTHSDWTGTRTDLFDNNDDTFIFSDSGFSDKFTSTLAAFEGTQTGYDIQTVNLTSRAWMSVGSEITNFRHMTRVGSTDYDGSVSHVVSEDNRAAFQTNFSTNPATGLPWTYSEVAAAEFGVKIDIV